MTINENDRPTREECERDELITTRPGWRPDSAALARFAAMDPWNPANQRKEP